MSWWNQSNRTLHFFYAIPCGFLFTVLFGLGIASGMEFKDLKYGNKWDWIDWFLTVAGSLLGNLIQIGFLYVLFRSLG